MELILKMKSKLTEEQKQKIRDLYNGGNITQKELGEQFGVSHSYIFTIIKGFKSLNEYQKHII